MTSHYQGLFIKNEGNRLCEGAHLDDVELHDLAGAGKALWLGDNGFAAAWATDGKPRAILDNVRVKPFEDRSLRDCVHPKPGLTWQGVPIGVLTDDDWQSAYWPEASGIVGRVVRI
jgi:hypothetical protein